MSAGTVATWAVERGSREDQGVCASCYGVYVSTTLSVRLGSALAEAAESFVAATGWTKTTLATTAIDEWLRLQAHPGIRFVSTPTGARVAALVNGPEIWTVAESWQQHEPGDRTTDNLVAATGLTRPEVECALSYYADYTEEIDAEVERVHVAQRQAREAWERRQALHA